jgi:hypothetical protein
VTPGGADRSAAPEPELPAPVQASDAAPPPASTPRGGRSRRPADATPDPGLRVGAYLGSALAAVGLVSGIVMITRGSTTQDSASGRVLIAASVFLLVLVGVAAALLRTRDDD